MLRFAALIVFVAAVLNYTLSAGTNWANIGPGGGSDLHMIIFDPQDENIIYTGGDIEGVFRSTDGGETWKNINNNMAQLKYGGAAYWINDIIIDSGKLFLCSSIGIFTSTNRGDSWEELWVSVVEEETVGVSTLALDPNNSQVIYMGLGDRSEGSSADFQAFQDFDSHSGIYKTTDGGTNWNELDIPLNAYNVHSLYVVPNNTDVVLAATSKGLIKSINGGDSWVLINNGLPHNNCHIMAGMDIEDTHYLFMTMKTVGDVTDENSFSGGIFRSDDLGDGWVDITSNLPKYDSENQMFNDYWKFDIDGENPEIVYIATTRGSSWKISGIFATYNASNETVEWELLHHPDLGGWLNNDWFGDPYAFDIQVAPSNSNRLVTCTDAVVISNNAGETWEQTYTIKKGDAWQTTGLELMNTDCIAFHQSNPDIIYVGFDDFGLFRSEDGGLSFYRLDTLQDPEIGNLSDIDGVKDIEVDPDNGDLYISRWQGSQGGYTEGYTAGGVVFSNDMGDTQSSISDGLPAGRCDLVLDKSSLEAGKRILYSAVYNNGVYKSTNSGESWSEISVGLGSNKQYAWEIEINPLNSDELYLGLNSGGQGLIGLFKSSNAGESWEEVNFFEGDILKIKIVNANKVYVTITDDFNWNYQGGLFLSEDGGESWQQLSTNIRIIDLDVNPLDTDILLASNQQWYMETEDQQGLYLSTNGGENWEMISSTIGHTFFNFSRFHPHRPHFVFTGTAGGGLWLSDSLDLSITGVNEVSELMNIEISPNPATDFIEIKNLTLSSLLGERNFNLEIYDVLGRRYTPSINTSGHPSLEGNYRLNVSHLLPGIYFVRVGDEFLRFVKI